MCWTINQLWKINKKFLWAKKVTPTIGPINWLFWYPCWPLLWCTSYCNFIICNMIYRMSYAYSEPSNNSTEIMSWSTSSWNTSRASRSSLDGWGRQRNRSGGSQLNRFRGFRYVLRTSTFIWIFSGTEVWIWMMKIKHAC